MVTVTLKDIAARAGVNTSTVSKALRGSSDIKNETCVRIRTLAAEMGYILRQPPVPSPVTTIGLVFPELGSWYYNDMQNAFQRRMKNAGLRTLITLSDFDVSREADAIEAFIADGVGGICYLTETEQSLTHVRNLVERTDIPFLLISGQENIDFCDSISINHTLGATLAVNHLIEQGHRRIAYIGETNTFVRQNGFILTMREHGLDLPPEYIVSRPERFELCGYRGMQQLLAAGNPPTAVFAAYDNIAYGAMRAIYEAGMRIPDDISLVGIDANPTSKYLCPALTSVDSPTADIGELASVLLSKRMEGRHTAAFQSIRLCPTLKIFETTAPPRI